MLDTLRFGDDSREDDAPAPGGGARAREAFRAGPEGRLVVAAHGGSLRIVGRESDLVLVEARGAAPGVRALDVQQEGADVYLRSDPPPGPAWLRAWQRCDLAIEVSVPARYAVDVETRDGCVRIERVRGPVEVRSRRGGLAFREVAGSIEARSGRGAIDVEGCSGELELRSERGAIRIEGGGA